MTECLSFHLAVEKKKETITESAGRQQKKKIGKTGRGGQWLENGWKLSSLWKWLSFPSFQNYLSKVVLEMVLGLMEEQGKRVQLPAKTGGMESSRWLELNTGKGSSTERSSTSCWTGCLSLPFQPLYPWLLLIPVVKALCCSALPACNSCMTVWVLLALSFLFLFERFWAEGICM